MTLKTIGDLKMIDDYFHEHDLNCDKPEVDGEDKFDLETRAILPSDEKSAYAVSNNNEHQRNPAENNRTIATNAKLWGLTRKGKWITIEVYVTRGYVPYHSGRIVEKAVAKKVTIRESSLSEICSFSKRDYQYIWQRLGEIIKQWTQRRKYLYEAAQKLEQKVLAEEIFMNAVTKK